VTKQNLEAEIAAQRDIIAALSGEITALYDIFAAVQQASDAGKNSDWIVGYIGGIGDSHRGNTRLLRTHATVIGSHPDARGEHTDIGELRDGDPCAPGAVPHCGAMWPNLGPAGGEWTCTLDRGHDGDHEALGHGQRRLFTDGSTIPQGHPDILEPEDSAS
jgi:hypothetical protein